MTAKDLIREVEELKIENDELRNQQDVEHAKRILAEKTLKKIRLLSKKKPGSNPGLFYYYSKNRI